MMAHSANILRLALVATLLWTAGRSLNAEEKPVGKSDDGSWGYIASLAAGAVVTAFGAVMTWGDWARMWSERSLTGDAWALIAGVFLMLAAAWSLGSVWLERLKKNRRATA